MAEESIKKIIRQLKALKEMKGLSIDDVVDILDTNNSHLARGTVAKIFSEGSEEAGYQTETIQMIANVMFDVYKESPEDDPEIKGLKTTIQLQNILIDRLKEQSADERRAAAEAVEAEKRNNAHRLEFLRERIRVQDHRIDQKDRMIAIMMIALLKKLDPDLISGASIDQYFSDKLHDLGENMDGVDDIA